MSGQWAAVAHRGQLDLDVLTKRRAIAEGYVLRPDVEFLGIVLPFGANEIPLGFQSFGRVASWVREMQPRELRVLAFDDEDEAELREAIADLALSGAAVQ